MRITEPKRFAIFSFAVGLLTAAAVVLLLSFCGAIHFVDDSRYDYYRKLDKSFGKYYEMDRLLREDALYEYDDSMTDDYISASLMSGLSKDKYASYMNEAEYSDMRKRLFASYIGIGVGISEEKEGIVIKTISKDGPADEAGLAVGDVIVKIDGSKVENVDEAIEAIEGKQYTKVELTVLRDGKEKSFKLYRQQVEPNSVNYRVYRGEIGYISISAFSKGTADEFRTAAKDLKAKGCKSLIIDLRNNGGGVTDEGIELADELLGACTITSCKYRNEKENEVHNSDASSIGMEYVLLVNGNTASASEIVTSAVKDNKGGKIIGGRTFGKGLIQRIKSFKDGSAMKYTIGEYYSPKGKKINGKGIKPDIEASDKDALDAAVKALGK